MLRRVFLDRHIRFLVYCALVLAAGMVIEVYFAPHYVAPFTAVFYAVGLQAMRHLWHWSPSGQNVGMVMVRLTVTVCVIMAGLRLFDRPLHLPIHERPPIQWVSWWYGPDRFGTERADVERKLEQLPGEQLAIVRYSPFHYPMDEWVYNAADIDGSKVIWAREMDATSNRELLQYYKNRKVWLVQPDVEPTAVSQYPRD
jgi:hypothetical protein